jgi:outer membrane protein TolC
MVSGGEILMTRQLIALLSLLLLFTNVTFAKEYTLQSILELAEKNNKDIKLASSNLDYANAVKKEAISQALPQIGAQLDYSRNFLKNKIFFTTADSNGVEETQSFTIGFDNAFQMSATLNQTLFGFGKIGNAIQAAGYFENFSEFQYSSDYQTIINVVKKAFYQALLLEKVWEVAVQSENSAKENYENIKLKFESGTVSEFDLLQAETRWQNSIPLTTQARKNYEVAVNNLKALVDIPLREEMILIGGLETFPPLPDSMNYDLAFKQRPDYNALLWERRLQEKLVAVEKSNYYPTLYGNITYLYQANSNQFQLDNKNENFFAGISLSVPIFTGFYTNAQVQKARIDVSRVKTRISKAHDEIRIQLQNINLRLREARERIEAAEKNIQTARRAYDIAETRVDNGLATQLEFRESRIDLDRAQVNFYIAIFDYLEAYFDWQLANGKVNMSGI